MVPFENRTKMSGFRMVDPFENRKSKTSGFRRIPDFEWSDFGSPLYWTKFSLVFKQHQNTGPFGDQNF